MFKIGGPNVYFEINNCVIENNSAIRGGVGLASTSSLNPSDVFTVRFINSVFRNNTARGTGDNDGGGVFALGTSLGDPIVIAEGCRFEGNTAAAGGAFYAGATFGPELSQYGLFKVDGCEFFNNSATAGDGGAIYIPLSL